MSNALAIAAATTTLRNLLLKGIRALDGDLNDLDVTTQPPDLARKNVTTSQLNLFLYQTAINGAWRNQDMPRQVRPGETGNPPLALNLHYLITAYGRAETDQDALSHRVLGGAMSVLHDHPLLDAGEIRNALKQNPGDPEPDPGDQIERLRVTPLPLSLDEMSKLWSAFQTNYRMSAAYEATVILIDSNNPSRAALPVLKRGKDDRGVNAVATAAAALRETRPQRSQPAARLGEAVAIVGDNLQTTDAVVRFTSLTASQRPPVEIAPLAGDRPEELKVRLQNHPEDPDALERWVPGFYTVSLVVKHTDVPLMLSNEVPFALAPIVTLIPNSTTQANVAKGDPLTLTCTPRLNEHQRVQVMFGDQQVAVTKRTNPVSSSPTYKETGTTITFDVPDVKAGVYLVRLRVDGVDSIPVILEGVPPLPVFDPKQQVRV